MEVNTVLAPADRPTPAANTPESAELVKLRAAFAGELALHRLSDHHTTTDGLLTHARSRPADHPATTTDTATGTDGTAREAFLRAAGRQATAADRRAGHLPAGAPTTRDGRFTTHTPGRGAAAGGGEGSSTRPTTTAAGSAPGTRPERSVPASAARSTTRPRWTNPKLPRTVAEPTVTRPSRAPAPGKPSAAPRTVTPALTTLTRTLRRKGPHEDTPQQPSGHTHDEGSSSRPTTSPSTPTREPLTTTHPGTGTTRTARPGPETSEREHTRAPGPPTRHQRESSNTPLLAQSEEMLDSNSADDGADMNAGTSEGAGNVAASIGPPDVTDPGQPSQVHGFVLPRLEASP
ncbi:hypothetical protein [Kitasatospora sp. NPDC093102]|uniref:hypothetical protein n=1 Tax=Kitasatospora sp. NPDC093102 TaxID=3155069 RepID=UPI003441037F